jgi:hypothetical protein
MDTHQFLTETEPQPDDDITEKIDAPVFPLAGMSMMIRLMSPDGREHWIRRGSLAHKVFVSHNYREVKR